MKKVILSALILGTSIVTVPSIQAKTSTGMVPAEPQIRVQIGRNSRARYRRARTVVSTRITRVGAWRFRETVRTTYLPNGTARTVVINRERLGRSRNY